MAEYTEALPGDGWYSIAKRLGGSQANQAVKDRNANYLAAANGRQDISGKLYPEQIIWYNPDKLVMAEPAPDPEPDPDPGTQWLLGKPVVSVYHYGPDRQHPNIVADVIDHFGVRPPIVPQYMQPTQQFHHDIFGPIVDAGMHALFTKTYRADKVTPPCTISEIADGTPAAIAEMNQFIGDLRQLADRNDDARVIATIDHEHEVKVNSGNFTGRDADPAVYGRALSRFISMCREQAPKVITAYWFGGSDWAAIDATLAAMTANPHTILYDPYRWTGSTGHKTFLDTAKPDFDQLTRNPDYARLGSPPVGLGETGVTKTYGDEGQAAWVDTIEAGMAELPLHFVVYFNRNAKEDHTLAGPKSIAALAALLGN